MTDAAGAQRSALLPAFGVVAAGGGIVAMCVSIVVAEFPISLAINLVGQTRAVGIAQVLFWIGSVLVLVGLVLGIVGLARRRHPGPRVMSAVAILLAVLPVVGLIPLVGFNIATWIQFTHLW
jgi:hypothetical protein